jgi:predicted nucleic acid-binding protein
METLDESIFLTCSITELGFVRILAQAAVYGFTVVQAQALLTGLKVAPGWSFEFVADMHDVSHLPTWVKQGSQTTDGHLLELARAHGAELATLDARIPGAFVIL